MRPVVSTCVASMQNIAAPDSARLLMCVKCQSLASPFSAEYWHIGATMMRLGSFRPRSFIGENRALIGKISGLEEGRAFWTFKVALMRLPALGVAKLVYLEIDNAVAVQQNWSSPRKRGPPI